MLPYRIHRSLTSRLVLCHFVQYIDEPFGDIDSGNGVFLILWLRKPVISLQPAAVEFSKLVAGNPHILILRVAKACTNSPMTITVLGYGVAHVFKKVGRYIIGSIIGAADGGTV